MPTMEVILAKDVDKVGRAGDVVRVRSGFGRNYLIPRGYALGATKSNIAQLEHHKRSIAREQAKVVAEYEAKAKALENVSVSIARKVGDGDKLFGSVGSKDIVDALAAQNVKLERKWLELSEPLKTVGSHEVAIRFSADIKASLKVTVVGIK